MPLLLLLVGWISSELSLGLQVDGFLPALFGSIVISIVGWLLSMVVGAGRKADLTPAPEPMARAPWFVAAALGVGLGA